jgi:hypothetical protein
VQQKKNVKGFAEPIHENDDDDSEEQEVMFKKPVSGASSRRKQRNQSIEKLDSEPNENSNKDEFPVSGERSNITRSKKAADMKTPS